jgi:iron complex transport system substrate-binding protein
MDDGRRRRAAALLAATAVLLAGVAGAVGPVAAATEAARDGTTTAGQPTEALGAAGESAPGGGSGAGVAFAQQSNGTCEFPVTVTDGTGTEVTLTEEPERVTTTGPAAAQTMWEIGAEGKVVGLTQYATYLEGAGNRTNVSGGFGFDAETVLGTNPDLVLVTNATNNGVPGRVETLRAAGVPTYVAPIAETFEDIHGKTRTIGRLVGACEAADERAERTARELEAVREVVGEEERPVALYYSFGFTVDETTFVHEMLLASGARNFGAGKSDDAPTGYFEVSPEVVVAFDTEWIVRNAGDTTPLPEAYDETTAVREDNVVTVNSDYVSQPAPRVVRPVRQMARAFHADAYAAANESADGGDDPPPASGGGGGDDDDEDDDGGGGGASAQSASTATPTATPTPTATATSTPAPTATPTGTATATATPTATATSTPAPTATPTGTATATPASSGSNPGLGPVAALLALLAVALLARR